MSGSIERQPTEMVWYVEKPPRPLLNNAGILDLNHWINHLPAEILLEYGRVDLVNPEEMSILISEVKTRVLDQHNLSELKLPNFQAKHELYPILENSPIAALAKTKIFTILFGKHQLGLDRHYPLPNPHTRGEHSIYLTVDLMRTFQSLDEKSHGPLVERLRRDFEGIGRTDLVGLEGSELVERAAGILLATGMLHDLMMPAGGDTLKAFMKNNGVPMDEEDNLAWFFSEENLTLKNERDELRQVIKDTLGIDDGLLAYMVECIQGKSRSLIGSLINPHPDFGDLDDADRRAYVGLDGVVETIFDQEIPTIFLLSELPPEVQTSFAIRLNEFVKTMMENEGVNPQEGFRGKDGMYLPVNLLDCAEQFIITEKYKLVCTNPRRLSWITLFRSYMVAYHYKGAQMQGPEKELSAHLQKLWGQERAANILTKENLLGSTDAEFFAQLDALGVPELSALLKRNETSTGSRFTPISPKIEPSATPLEYLARRYLEKNLGLDSLVLDPSRGKVATLRAYLAGNTQFIPAQLFEKQQEKQRLI